MSFAHWCIFQREHTDTETPTHCDLVLHQTKVAPHCSGICRYCGVCKSLTLAFNFLLALIYMRVNVIVAPQKNL